jgi:hypothetical protein
MFVLNIIKVCVLNIFKVCVLNIYQGMCTEHFQGVCTEHYQGVCTEHFQGVCTEHFQGVSPRFQSSDLYSIGMYKKRLFCQKIICLIISREVSGDVGGDA